MSYIQCKDRNEVEKVLKGRNAFVTEDFRIYDKIELWDNACATDLCPDQTEALLALKQNIEMIGEDGFEMSFTQLAKAAKYAEDAYSKVAQILKRKKP